MIVLWCEVGDWKRSCIKILTLTETAMRTLIATSIILLTGVSNVIGQDDVPHSDREAVSSYQYSVQVERGEEQEVLEYLEDGTTRAYQINRAYRSPNLRGNFLAQWMFIRQNGSIVRF